MNDKTKETQIRPLVIGTAISVLIIILFFSIRYLTQEWKYRDNIQCGNDYYTIAKYDSALTCFNEAIRIKTSDSLELKITAIKHLLTGLKNYYNFNFDQAISNFQQSADLGSGHAEYYLGEMYFNGFGVPRDYDKGLFHTQNAIKSNFKMANYRLAICYRDGLSVKKNKVRSDSLFKESYIPLVNLANAKDPEALGCLSSMFGEGTGVKKNLIKSLSYSQKSLDCGNNHAIVYLASLYLFGEGVKTNPERAIQLLSDAVKRGDEFSMYFLGRLYINGSYVTQDFKKGLALLKNAANKKNSYAIHYLGKIYSRIYYLPVYPNYELAIKYFEETIRLNKYNAEVISDMGFIHQCGFGVKKDYKKAIEYYLKSNDMDSIKCNSNLFFIAYLKYLGGNGIQRDRTEAAHYLKRAANLGNETAKEYLNNMNELNYILYGCAVDTFHTYIE